MIGIFGGTFDPIHQGHLNIATHCIEQLPLSTLAFMPCAQPAHKTHSGVSAEQRLAMVKLAIAQQPKFTIDDRELKRKGPSYSLLSLQELRQEHPNDAIAFLIGMDSLNNLHKWYQWQEVVDLCHLIVCQRPGEALNPSPVIRDYIARNSAPDVHALKTKQAGLCYFLATSLTAISSSELREQLKTSPSLPEHLPTSVANYIKNQHIYC
ncbi:nicotinate-nucleotide adenylyltransferase [Pseudoalteromonas ulvae UL12]|uniref:nicotinate-nucleotide adenylyltransferase n=1 Tax=Pseudoalteromonas ulvae TaxID=107327 RepID=UPI00186BB1E9|nr:nicotinate-nucleotide adenylyltransferase [Pseudoalteromonas ulvae]MBE0362511.1 nicotinate-nucleotide adenylyltransferase [Pseudoalteromonas ulvae UL12]